MKKFSRIKALDRFILSELAGPFFFGIMAFTIILVAGGLLFKIADLIIERGVSFGIVIRLFLYYLPRLVAVTIPMSCLLATLLGFGTLSANSELVALKSAGLSFNRIIRPVLVVSFIVSICAFFIDETLVPVSERAASKVMLYEVMKKSPPMFAEKIFLKEEEGENLKRVIYVNRIRKSTGRMSDIVVQEFEDGSLTRITTAKDGAWVDGSWWIYNGATYQVKKDNSGVDVLYSFQKQELNLNMDKADVTKAKTDPDEMNMFELLRTIRANKKLGENSMKLRMAMHLRFAVPCACMVMALVGAALGSRPQRSSSSLGLGLSVMIVFVYYVIMSFSKSIGEAGYVPPVIAAWIANAVFFVVGFKLCKRADKLG